MTLAAVLPFFDFESRSDSAVRRGLVPVKRLMGSSWRWHEGSLPHGVHTIQEGIAIFTAPNCAEPGLQVAEVTLIRPLGLFYVSGEGKNRVAFLARNNIEWMPCRLAERTYPAAERLQTFEVVEGSIRTWMCVLDSKFAVTLPYPEITIPLLEAYGVRQTAEWPRGWPMCATAITAVRLQPTRDGSACDRASATSSTWRNYCKASARFVSQGLSIGRCFWLTRQSLSIAEFLRGRPRRLWACFRLCC